MRSYKTLTLSLLITFVAFAAIFLATRSSQGRYAAPDKKTIKVLRKKNQLGVKPTAQEIAAQPQERELEDKIPKHLPIKVKVKNLNNEKWVRDLEIEVKNTGDKPIYYLSFSLSLPEVKSDGGIVIGFDLRFGRPDLSAFKNRPLPEDVPIQPGDTYILKVLPNQAKGWELFKGRRKLSDPKKFQIKFHLLHYGDGTGFMTTGGLPVPNPNASRASCGEKKGDVADAPSTVARSTLPHNTPLQFSSSFMPVNLVPAKYATVLPAAPVPNTASPSSGLCCPGTSCYYASEVQNGHTCATCGPASWVESVGCDSPDGYCGQQETQDRTCPDAYGYEANCTFYFLDPCPPPRPNTSPTPSGSPSPPPPSPSATPAPGCTEDCTRCDPNGTCNPTAPGGPRCEYPSCVYGPSVDTCTYPSPGCPNNAYYIGGSCCQCVNDNPTCPEGYYWDKDRCDCVAAPTPVPSATPTPGGGGSYYSYSICTEYYWVTYESYDGGQTWYEVDRAYVGCW